MRVVLPRDPASPLAEAERLLTEAELAAWRRVSLSTVRRERRRGGGPPYIMLSARRVGYSLPAARAWLLATGRPVPAPAGHQP